MLFTGSAVPGLTAYMLTSEYVVPVTLVMALARITK